MTKKLIFGIRWNRTRAFRRAHHDTADDSRIAGATGRPVAYGVVLLAALLLLPSTFLAATGVPEEPMTTTRSVTDALGRTVTVPADPQRVVVAGRAVLMIADVLYAFEDAPERIVGIGRISQGEGNFVAALDSGYGDKATFERNVGPEQIAGLNPDLVILKTYMKESLGDALSRLGIAVIYVELETPEQYERDILLLGTALDEEVRARSLSAFFREERLAVESVTEAIPATERPATLLLYYRATGGEVSFQVPPASWIQTRLVESAGGTPVWTGSVASGGWQTVGFEQIAAWNPETIVFVSYNEDAGAIADRLAGDQRWQALRAVDSGNLYAFPADFYSWDQPDTRWLLGMKWLATRLQPQLFSDLSIGSEAERFFRIVYGLDSEGYEELIAPLLAGELD